MVVSDSESKSVVAGNQSIATHVAGVDAVIGGQVRISYSKNGHTPNIFYDCSSRVESTKSLRAITNQRSEVKYWIPCLSLLVIINDCGSFVGVCQLATHILHHINGELCPYHDQKWGKYGLIGWVTLDPALNVMINIKT